MKRDTNRTIGGKAKIERVTADGEPVVRVTFGHWSAVGIFLIVWITGWSFGCYKLVSDLVSKPFNVGEALFALPFFAGEIFVAWMILLMIFGRTVFTFRREGGTKFTGVGSIGFTKEFSFPIKGELCTDEEVRHGSKGGTYTVYRFIVKTQFDLDGPRVIYDSTDGDIVYALCEAAKEIAITAGAPKPEEKSADEIADEEAGIERLDYELLAGRPPKGMSVSRDFEGRIFVVLRRVRWMMAVVLLAAMAFFTWLNWFKFTDVPIPAKIGFVFVMLFPFVLFLSALFGKRTMTLDHGNGTTFFGVGPLGLRRRFEYGGAFNVKVAESALWVNNERMNELVIAKPDGTQQKICASWPNDVKPYLAAFLRHPGSAAVEMAVALVGVVVACGAMAEEIVDFAREGHGWCAANHVENIRQTATGYAFDVTDIDPWCVASATYAMPKQPEGAAYLRIELETAPVENPVSFQIYWHAGEPLFTEQESAFLKPVGPSPCATFVAELPVGLIGPDPVALRIDPPGKSAAFADVEVRRLCASYMTAEWTPNFSAPPPIAFVGEPLVLKGDGWELRHDRTRMGAFAFVANGKTWAEGYPNEPIVVQDANGEPESLDWSKGETKVRMEGKRIEASATAEDSAGRTWVWMRTFISNGKMLQVISAVAVDRPACVYHIPYMTLFVDRASDGRKKQALLPGIEYLADEPSSNEKEVRGSQANRLIPAAHKFCYPMMAIADDTSWFAFEWRNSDRVNCPVFDTPDRQFKSGGHLFALWEPGIGPARREGDMRLFTAVPFTAGGVGTTLSTGAGGDVVDALVARYPLEKLPPTPELDAAQSCDVLTRGWLDSGIRDGARGCRHALGSNWYPYLAADVPALMLWLASATPDAEKSAKLSAAANEMIAAFPEGATERRGWGGSVSHVKRPAAPLVFGDPLAYSAAQGASARSLALQLADGKCVWRKLDDGNPDLGETLGADHCNGYSAISVSDMLSAALWTGDEKAIADALAVLDKFTAIYGNDVPRGAQPWEMPLHTPDILASGRLVDCYVKGYLLSGDARYLERARYWARTGMTMVYFVDPPTDRPNPIGRYATIGVIGATHWVAPNWIGLPVQWCGLVYSAALADLAEIETDAGLASLWRHLAKGITASGIDQSYLPSDGEKVGLLPDSFDVVSQVRRDPPINPGTVQENVSNFVGLPYYRVVRATPDGKTLVHVPGRAKARAPHAGELARVEIAAWPKAPYKVFFSRVARPSAVKANGVNVPFEFRDNVMSVILLTGDGPIRLVLEAAPQ